MATTVGTVRDAALDLLLGSSCVGCARPGRLLCVDCRATLPTRAVPAVPEPGPPGLVETWAGAVYADTVRAMVVGLKERRLLALARPLAGLMAAAVATDLDVGSHGVTSAPWVLVPVPSRPATVRARGHDPTHAVTTGAARLLRRAGLDVTTRRLLRLRPGVVDQAGLDAVGRAVNLAGSMHCPSPGVRRLARACPEARLVVCDDVVTTGSTAREAQRALEAVGLLVVRVAAVAATPRRYPPPYAGSEQAAHDEFSALAFRDLHPATNVGAWSPPDGPDPGGVPQAV